MEEKFIVIRVCNAYFDITKAHDLVISTTIPAYACLSEISAQFFFR